VERRNRREQEKCPGYRVPRPFSHAKTLCAFDSHIGRRDCGQAPKGCKGGKKISPGIFPMTGQRVPKRVGRLGTPPLGIVSFLLTPQERRRRIPATFSVGFWSRGTGTVHWERKKSRVIPEGEKACSICRDGLCSALTRSARLAATGCVQVTPEENSAAIAALRFAMFRHQSAHACGCVPARWVVTVHRAARQDDSGNQRERSSGPPAPVPPGRAVPASSTATHGCAVFATSSQPRIPDDPKARTARSSCPSKTCSELTPEMGRAAGRGPAARGAWAK
jgi:hypothetical protein